MTPAGVFFYIAKNGECRYLIGIEGRYKVAPLWTGIRKRVAMSLKEWKRWKFLELEMKNGRIHALRMQQRFPLHGRNGALLTRYVADFVYVKNGVRIVEDVKSEATRKLAMYVLKKAWMRDEYGIKIQEV